jgi:hypothetical protein
MMIVRLLISLAAAVGLAACSGNGGSSTPYAGGSSNAASSAMQKLSSMESSVPDARSVTVKPDKVDLTTKKTTETVTVDGPTGSTFTYKDNCVLKGIASVAVSGTDTYLVTAGAKAGKCTATFFGRDAGKKVGSAVLAISNTL